MTDFERKKIKQKSVGEQLRNLRERENLSIDEIATKTKIRRKYIQALEASDWNKLPSTVYVRGFINSYAGIVGGNSRNLVRAFTREQGVSNYQEPNEKNKSIPFVVNDANLRKYRVTFTSRWLWLIGSICAVGVLVFYLYSTYTAFVSKPLLIITSPQNNVIVDSLDLTISGQVTPSASVTVNNQAAIVGANGEFQKQIVLSSGVNAITVIATNRFDKSTQSVIMVDFRQEVPVEIEPIDQALKVEGDLETGDDVEIESSAKLEIDSNTDMGSESITKPKTDSEIDTKTKQDTKLDTRQNVKSEL